MSLLTQIAAHLKGQGEGKRPSDCAVFPGRREGGLDRFTRTAYVRTYMFHTTTRGRELFALHGVPEVGGRPWSPLCTSVI